MKKRFRIIGASFSVFAVIFALAAMWYNALAGNIASDTVDAITVTCIVFFCGGVGIATFPEL